MTKKNIIYKKPAPFISTIDVKFAKLLLASMPTNQRAVRKTHVTKIATILKAGLWKLDGQTVKVDRNGAMFDGQHRCLAVVQTGITIPTVIVYGLDPTSFATVDSELAIRRLRDKISSQFPDLSKESNHIAQIYGKVLDYEGTSLEGYESMGHRNRGTWNYKAAFQWIEKNRTHLKKILSVITTVDAKITCRPLPIFGAMYFLFRKASPKDADKFFEILVEGLHYPQGRSDPIYWCSKEISALHAKHTKGVWPKRYTYYAALDYAWQKYMNREKVKSAKELRIQRRDGYIKFDPKKRRK